MARALGLEHLGYLIQFLRQLRAWSGIGKDKTFIRGRELWLAGPRVPHSEQETRSGWSIAQLPLRTSTS